jgi:hypothetical protein
MLDQTVGNSRASGSPPYNGLDSHIDAGESKDEAGHVNGQPAPAKPRARRPTKLETSQLRRDLWHLVNANRPAALRQAFNEAGLLLLIKRYAPASEVMRVKRAINSELGRIARNVEARRARRGL